MSSGAGGRTDSFIEANKVALSNDIARGNGATLASLTRMYGCSNVDAVAPVLQKRYEEIFPTQNASAATIVCKISNIIDTTQLVSKT